MSKIWKLARNVSVNKHSIWIGKAFLEQWEDLQDRFNCNSKLPKLRCAKYQQIRQEISEG